MARTRRVTRRIPRGPRPKYSMVTFSRLVELPASTEDPPGLVWNWFTVTPSTTLQGMRKAKNFSIEFGTNSTLPIGWALCYLPQGANAGAFLPSVAETNGAPEQTSTFVEMFANSQWVISNGTIVAGAITRFRTRLARNLNNGDQIIMFIFNPQGLGEHQIYVSGNYAIKYN